MVTLEGRKMWVVEWKIHIFLIGPLQARTVKVKLLMLYYTSFFFQENLVEFKGRLNFKIKKDRKDNLHNFVID